MRRLVLKICLAIGLSWLIATLVFFSVHVLPGDLALQIAASRFVNTQPDTTLAESLRTAYGLDRPLIAQYGDWIFHILQLDFGRSLVSGRLVTEDVAPYLRNTLVLGGYGLLGAVLLAFPLGFLAGRRPGSVIDQSTSVYCGIIAAVPTFLLGTLLIRFFVVEWQIGTLSGNTTFSRIVLPVTVASLAVSAPLMRVVRNAVADVTDQPYFFFARMRGVPPRQLFLRHGLRNASLPVLAYMSTLFVVLIYDLVVIEVVFNYPGIGYALYGAIKARDIPVIQYSAFLLVLSYLLLTATVDLISSAIDPRIGRNTS